MAREPMWAIRNKLDKQMFWDNDCGWTSFNDTIVTQWSADEKHDCHLPLDGEWVRMKDIYKEN